MVLWLGALCCFTGYIGLHLMATGKTDGGFAQLLLFAVAAGEWYQCRLQRVDCEPCTPGYSSSTYSTYQGIVT